MIRTKSPNQTTFVDPWDYLGPKRKKRLLESWAGTFRDNILPELPVNSFAKHFSTFMGRPTKELTSALGFLILQQALDLCDTEAVHELAFNIQWHYALNRHLSSLKVAILLIIKIGMFNYLISLT